MRWASFRFLLFYLAGGLIAMLAQVAGDPQLALFRCLGASGAIAAVMGAFIVTYPRDRIRTFIFFLIFFVSPTSPRLSSSASGL